MGKGDGFFFFFSWDELGRRIWMGRKIPLVFMLIVYLYLCLSPYLGSVLLHIYPHCMSH